MLFVSNPINGIYLLRHRAYHRRHGVITTVHLKQQLARSSLNLVSFEPLTCIVGVQRQTCVHYKNIWSCVTFNEFWKWIAVKSRQNHISKITGIGIVPKDLIHNHTSIQKGFKSKSSIYRPIYIRVVLILQLLKFTPLTL